MDREEAVKRIKAIQKLYGFTPTSKEAIDLAIEALQKVYVYEQVKWERDWALKTLEEHGIGLGQKAESATTTGCDDCIWNICNYNKIDWEVSEDCISRADIEYHTQLEANGNGQYEEVEVAYKSDIDNLPSVTPKPVMTEEVREALMRLTMCAREECSICKYENNCGFDKQVEMATKSMNTILKAFQEPPTERTGEWVVSGMDRDGDYMGSRWYTCSQCGGAGDKGDNFCKRCGAKMGGDTE